MSPQIIEVDFSDAPPAQGRGNVSDHVPPGTYSVTAVDADGKPAKSGRPMVTVQLRIDSGPSEGKQIWDRFAFARPGTDDSKFGVQRFNAFIVALALPEQTKKVKLELDKLKNRRCLVDLDDEETPATLNEDGTVQYAARVTSRAIAYHPIATAAAKPAPAAKAPEVATEVPAEQAALPDDQASAEGDLPVDDPSTELGDLFS